MKRFFAGLLLALACALPASAAYPERAITIVVPLPPGGPADAVARVVGQKLGERLGQPVTIDNKPGALGLIGAEIGAHAKPDGYTIVMVSSGLAIQVATQPRTVKFDVHKDLQPLTYAVKVPMVFAANPAAPFKTMKEFVDYAKTKPGAVSVGVSPGLGGTAHLTLERMKLGFGLDVVAVPYKGSAPALQDLVAGQIQVQFDPGTLPLIADGRVKGLAVIGDKRWPRKPDMPTLSEQGYGRTGGESWHGIVAIKGTPQPVVDALSNAIDEALKSPDVVEKLANVQHFPSFLPPEAFREKIVQERKIYGDVIRKADIKL